MSSILVIIIVAAGLSAVLISVTVPPVVPAVVVTTRGSLLAHGLSGSRAYIGCREVAVPSQLTYLPPHAMTIWEQFRSMGVRGVEVWNPCPTSITLSG